MGICDNLTLKKNSNLYFKKKTKNLSFASESLKFLLKINQITTKILIRKWIK